MEHVEGLKSSLIEFGASEEGTFTLAFTTITFLYFAVGYIVDPARGKYGRSTTPVYPSTLFVVLSVLFALYSITISSSSAYDELVYGNGLCEPTPEKPFNSFHDFYNTSYVKEHQVRLDRGLHVIILLSTMSVVCSRTSLLVTWCVMMGVGALVTKPLLSFNVPFLEAAVMMAVASVVSSRFDVNGAFFVVASLWTTADLLSHVFVGMNGDAALYIGQHYLSWGLWGQVKLVLGMLLDGTVDP